jgi:hypothetical protein
MSPAQGAHATATQVAQQTPAQQALLPVYTDAADAPIAPLVRRPEGPVLGGKVCHPGGPSVRTKVVGELPGKPPMTTLYVDIHVVNPLTRKVWLVYNVGGTFPSAETDISLRRATYGIPPADVTPRGDNQELAPLPESLGHDGYLWSLQGDDGWAEAVLLLPGANIELLSVALRPRGGFATVYFVDAITVGNQTASAWLGRPGVAPRDGAFYVKSSVVVHERDGADKASVTMKVNCYQSIDFKVREPER